MRFDVVTLFPEIFEGYLSQSLLCDALQNGLVSIHRWNLREFGLGRHKQVDDRPFGGGPGMLLRCEPVFACLDRIRAATTPAGNPSSAACREMLILLTPQGERLNQQIVHELASYDRLVLLCGRYEGFDERIALGLNPRTISIGDYVCNGGEVPAMVLIDTVIRYVPGVLGDENSVRDESFQEPGRIEYPQYTRPREFRGMTVPDVLLSGNHAEIARWRAEQSARRSQQTHKHPQDTTEGPGHE